MLALLSIVLPFAPRAVLSSTPDESELSLDRALTLAEWRSTSVRLAEAELDLAHAKANSPEVPLVAGRLGVKAADKAVGGAKASLTLAVRRAYFGCVLAREGRLLAEKGLEVAKKGVEVSRSFYDAGMTSRKELYDAEARLYEAHSGLEKAKAAEEQAYTSLCAAVGLPMDARPELTTPLEYSPMMEPDLDSGIKKALSNRSEVYIAERNVEIAEASEDVARELGVPYQISIASAEAAKARINLESQRDLVELQVRQAYSNLSSAKKVVAHAHKAVSSAEESLRITRLKYEQGMATGLEVAQAELALAQAKFTELQAVYEHELARWTWEAVTGEAFYGSSAQSGYGR